MPVRTDADLAEVIHIVGAIAKIPATDPAQIEHILEVAPDGFRDRPAGA